MKNIGLACVVFVQPIDKPEDLGGNMALAFRLHMLNKFALPPLQFIVAQGESGLEIHGIIPDAGVKEIAASAPSKAVAKPAQQQEARMPAFGNN